MKFGYGMLSAQRPSDSDRSYEAIYDETIRLASLAEEHRFDAVWTTEHHFWDDGYTPSPLTLCAGIATATESIDVGTAVALAPLYDPIRLAEDAATVDLLSGGRFTLGLANGYIEREFDVFDVPMAERGRRTIEAVEILKRAWEPDSFSYDGEIFRYEDLRVTPEPAQPDGPPVLLGGTSKPAVERAGEIADGHIGVVYYPDELEDVEGPRGFDRFRRAGEYLREHHVDDDFVLSFVQYAHVAETDDAAWEALQPAFLYSRRKYAEHAEDRDTSTWDGATIDDDRLSLLRDGTLCGAPETIVDQLRTYEEAIPGELHFLARLWHPTMSFDEHAEAIRLFGSEVIPEFE